MICSQQIHHAISQSERKLGKTGTVTLKLTVSQLDDMSVVVTPDIKTSIPQPAERSQHKHY
jgi:hypothetical protein